MGSRPTLRVLLVLTVTACCALGLGQIRPEEYSGQAEASVSSPTSAIQQHSKTAASQSRAATATLPMRWVVPGVHESVNVNGAYCSTAITVTTAFNVTTFLAVQVEFFDDIGLSMGTFVGVPHGAPGVRTTYITDSEVTPIWTVVDGDADLSNFTGSATVHSDDPRIMVTAFEWCRSGTGAATTLLTVRDLPAYPIGATLEYFQAGMPTTWTPPMAAPEEPESSSEP